MKSIRWLLKLEIIYQRPRLVLFVNDQTNEPEMEFWSLPIELLFVQDIFYFSQDIKNKKIFSINLRQIQRILEHPDNSFRKIDWSKYYDSNSSFFPHYSRKKYHTIYRHIFIIFEFLFYKVCLDFWWAFRISRTFEVK